MKKWLQQKETDVNHCRGELGGTALHWAAHHGKTEIAQLLLIDTEASMFKELSTV